jgi:hypothetical protein
LPSRALGLVAQVQSAMAIVASTQRSPGPMTSTVTTPTFPVRWRSPAACDETTGWLLAVDHPDAEGGPRRWLLGCLGQQVVCLRYPNDTYPPGCPPEVFQPVVDPTSTPSLGHPPDRSLSHLS